jgi:F5/8 type C domain/Glycosyl hydrolases family 28
VSPNADVVATGAAMLPVVDVKASSDDGHRPANTVDADPATRWSAEGDGQWIRWDLGAPHRLTRVRLAFFKGDSRVNTFDLEASSDGTTFAPVLGAQRSGGTTDQLEPFDFPAVDARYVRYVGHGNVEHGGAVSAWNSLTEVEVWAADPAGDLGGTETVTPQVVTYPQPPSLTTSPVYRVFAGSPEREIWTEQFTKNRTIHLAGFSAAGEVPIRIEINKPFLSVQISPKSRELHAAPDGKSVRFTIKKPEKLIIFVRTASGELDPLYLFADPLEVDPPTPATPHVRYFAPGEHAPGVMNLQTGDTVYLAGGALVTGRIVANRATNITVRGRGTLREPAGNGFTIRMQDCRNVLVEGVVVRDLQEDWSTRYDRCNDVMIRDVKIFSCGVREDGVDPCGCTNFTIDRCLISTGDDCVAIKSLSSEGVDGDDGSDVSGIKVLNTVLDSYPHGGGGDGVKIGTETQCHEMRDILVQNCDVVRAFGENDVGGHSAFSIVHKGKARIHGVRYEDIRVEDRIQHKDFEIVLRNTGTVSDVTLKDIAWEVEKDINLIGADISNVTFQNCTVAGKALEPAQVNLEDGPTGITFH